MKAQYIQDYITKEIFKYSKANNYWIKVSPWDNKEDRRRFNDNNSIALTPKDATQILNKVFDNVTSVWDYEDKHYVVSQNLDEIDYANVPYHYFDNKRFRIVWHQGRLYWAYFGNKMPRLELYSFYNLDTAPSVNKGPVKFTNFRHCKPIWVTTSQVYL